MSLGLLAVLRTRVPHDSISFFKPVGQQHVEIDGVQIDKDCKLAKEYFGLSCPYSDMSPVLMPRGYTKNFIDGKINLKQQEDRLLHSWNSLKAAHPNSVVEGTGHMGVGSIVGLDNARVAKLLGLEVALVCEGGLGSAFDELSMNVSMCARQGVKVRCVIVNRVMADKADMLRDYFSRALEPLGMPLAGLVPLEPFLSSASLMDFANLFRADFISGEAHRLRHCDGVQLVSSDVARLKERLACGDYRRKLLVVHGSRLDVLSVCLDEREGFEGGIIFTGKCSWPPGPEMLDLLRSSDVPALHAPVETMDAIFAIQKHTAKLNATDTRRTEAAVKHIMAHVDLDLVLTGKSGR